MPFPTNPALEAAVIADCENDLPRMVYADFLDEHGVLPNLAFCWRPQEVSKRVMTKLRKARGDIYYDWPK